MLKLKILLHQAQIEKAIETAELSVQARSIINNMQHLIDELLIENSELEQALNEEG
ncbi:hypothetical protein GW796_01035 [archaeon]|nr:hypothetical protein [archaeon]